MNQQFQQQFSEQLKTWVAALRAGYSPVQALDLIAQDSPEPTSSLLYELIKEVRQGVPLYDALKHLLVRTEGDDLDLIAQALAVQLETGGSLADKLDLVTQLIDKRTNPAEDYRQ
ncbi:MAG: type II secretion system F family protein [bacterium]|nr:type II secretion system F family protein [bacterium]